MKTKFFLTVSIVLILAAAVVWAQVRFLLVLVVTMPLLNKEAKRLL